MPYYLAPYIGTGTRADGFRPRGSGQPGWSAIDLRSNAALAAGRSILHLPVADPDPLLTEVALDKLENISGARLTALRNQLGLPGLPASRFDALVTRILKQPPAGGWNPLQPTATRFEVWLNGLLWDEPLISGGASDNFNRANESPIASPWVRSAPSDNFDLISNAVQAVGAVGDRYYHYSGAVTSADQYAQAKMVTSPTEGGLGLWGPVARSSTDGRSYYGLDALNADEHIYKIISGSYTRLVGVTTDVVDGDTIRIEVEGSTIRFIKNGSEVTGSPTTDTSLTTAGNGVGLNIYNTGGAIDDWEGGDLVAVPPSIRFDYSQFPKPKIRPAAAVRY